MIETSIIIRTKNEERWIGKVLERLVSQTYQDFEIIIVDDGSTDTTEEIVNALKDKRLIYYKIKNKYVTTSHFFTNPSDNPKFKNCQLLAKIPILRNGNIVANGFVYSVELSH